MCDSPNLDPSLLGKALDDGCQVDVAFVDVSKAFYTVSFSLVRNVVQGLNLNTALWHGPRIRVKTLTSFKEFPDKPLIYCEI